MRFLEYERASWLHCFLATFQEIEAYSPHTVGQERRPHLSPRNMGRMIFCKRVMYFFQFRLFVAFTLNNANAGVSVIFIRKHLLPDESIVNHVTTCQGRDHIVTIRSGGSVMVIVNVHFEPDLISRDLRERLRHISLHWPRYLESME